MGQRFMRRHACAWLIAALAAMPASLATDDPYGDVDPAGTGTGLGGTAASDAFDLLEGWVEETDALHVTIGARVAQLEENVRVTPPADRQIHVILTWRDTEYRLSLGSDGEPEELERASATGWEPAGTAVVAVDEAEDTVSWTIERKLLTASDGTPPARGDSMDIIWRTATGNAGAGQPPTADRMPDADVAQHTFILGDTASGDLRMFTSTPRRASNGEPTTIVFPMTVRNGGNDEASVVLSVEGIPQGWSVQTNDAFLLPGGEDTRVPVTVTIPTAHTHGEDVVLDVIAQDAEDADSFAASNLYVHFLDPPQLSGHHPRLYLHGERAPLVRGGPSEVEATPRHALAAIPPQDAVPDMPWSSTAMPTAPVAQTVQDSVIYTWPPVRLAEALRLGLTFAGGNGTADLTFVTGPAGSDVTVSAQLIHEASGNDTILWQANTTVADWPAESRLDIHLAAPMLVETVDVAEGAQLEWQLVVSSPVALDPRSDGSNLAVAGDGLVIDLPLMEHREAPEASGTEALSLSPRTTASITANPGDRRTVVFTLQNGGAAAGYTSRVDGAIAEWLATAPSGTLGAGGSERITLTFNVPDDASTDRRHNAVLVVGTDESPPRFAFHGLEIQVVDEAVEDVPSDPEPTAPKKSSPGPWWVVAAAVIIAWRRDRPA